VLTRAADDQASTLGGQALDMIGALQVNHHISLDPTPQTLNAKR